MLFVKESQGIFGPDITIHLQEAPKKAQEAPPTMVHWLSTMSLPQPQRHSTASTPTSAPLGRRLVSIHPSGGDAETMPSRQVSL